jgi:hypothetical protein
MPTDRDAERALLGTRLEHRPDQVRMLQARLSAADETLPEEVRALHPIRSLGQIELEYRGRWLALWPTAVTAGLAIAAGRVLAEGDERADISDRIAAIKREHPQLRSLFAYRAGSSATGRAARHG